MIQNLAHFMVRIVKIIQNWKLNCTFDSKIKECTLLLYPGPILYAKFCKFVVILKTFVIKGDSSGRKSMSACKAPG